MIIISISFETILNLLVYFASDWQSYIANQSAHMHKISKTFPMMSN